MIRRAFLSFLGAAAAWPFAAHAQPQPVIGYLSSVSQLSFAPLLVKFNEGLRSQGYVDGRNIRIEQRWARGQYDELKALAADLVQQQVNVLVATGGVRAAQAAKAATKTIPTVFIVGYDPVKLDLVESFKAPGGNATGVTLFTTELATKRLELLRELLPQVSNVGILVNPGSVTTEIEVADTRVAANKLGIEIEVFAAKTEMDLQTAFDSAMRKQAGALLVSADPFFTSQGDTIVALAASRRLPTMYPFPSYVDAGGLVSYGAKLTWAYQEIGVYAGRILKGAKAAQLPVQQPVEVQLILNLKSAKALGLTVPPAVSARADRVIE